MPATAPDELPSLTLSHPRSPLNPLRRTGGSAVTQFVAFIVGALEHTKGVASSGGNDRTNATIARFLAFKKKVVASGAAGIVTTVIIAWDKALQQCCYIIPSLMIVMGVVALSTAKLLAPSGKSVGATGTTSSAGSENSQSPTNHSSQGATSSTK